MRKGPKKSIVMILLAKPAIMLWRRALEAVDVYL